MHLADVSVRAPFPWAQLLEYYSYRLTPTFESVEDGRYVRAVGKRTVTVEFDAKKSRLLVSASGRIDAADMIERVERLFDVAHDHESIHDRLHRSSVLRPRLRRLPGMRPLGAWSPFELCVRTILGQQVTVAAAGTLMRRLVERCGSITPQCIVDADLANMGMPGKRVAAIQSFARALLERRVDFSRPWAQVNAALQELPGFGPWTRAYLAIRLGRDPDAFPESDLGLIRAANAGSPAELLELAEAWRPLRAYAATYLWAVAV
jgi:3-methyladenine DNA glycosylase/8-oxoguanine DNA glycosylase